MKNQTKFFTFSLHQVFDWPKPKENVVDGPASLGTLYNVRHFHKNDRSA